MAATYAARPVEAIPSRGKSGGGGRSLVKVLAPIFADLVGTDGAFEIGTYESATGASTAKRTVLKNVGEFIPEGHAFDIESRRTGEKESKLYATYVHPAEEDNDDGE